MPSPTVRAGRCKINPDYLVMPKNFKVLIKEKKVGISKGHRIFSSRKME